MKPRDHGPIDDRLWRSHPNLAAYLYKGSWNNITPRDPSSLDIRCKAGIVVAKLRCPTEGLQIEYGGSSLQAALNGLERLLGNSDSPWQEMRSGTGAQKARDIRKKALDELKLRGDD